jgi:hypothetical protein
MNPKAPQIHGTLKLHIQNKPIRPIVNWKGSPGYKLCKHLNTLLNNTLILPYTFKVQNSHSIIQSLQNIEIDENTKLCSFDIENMYTNIPTSELKNVIKNIVDQNHNMSNIENDELLNLLNFILEQNYFQFKNKFYKQNDGLAMGAPTSAILADTVIQYLEHKIISQILKKHQIIDYYRYVDDILIIYNEQDTNIQSTLDKFNNIHPKIKFTIEQESLNMIHCLDLTITKNTIDWHSIYIGNPPLQTPLYPVIHAIPTNSKSSNKVLNKWHEHIPSYQHQ